MTLPLCACIQQVVETGASPEPANPQEGREVGMKQVSCGASNGGGVQLHAGQL
jgi:hypothetical protein